MAMKIHQRRSVPRLLTPIALSIILSACSTQTSSPDVVDITAQPLLTTQTYLMRADASEGSQQSDWLIMALKAAIEENNAEQAQLLLMRIAKQPLTPTQQAQWQLLRAQLSIKAKQYQEALEQLSFQANWSLPQVQWQQYHQVRADIFTALDRPFDATRELIALYSLSADKDKQAQADQIWANLNNYSASKIVKLSAEPNEAQLSGWLQLAVYMKTLGNNLPQLKNTLEKWLAENPQHPVAIYTPKAISDILALEIVESTNTALLLPLTGKFAKQAAFIRDGFVFAMMNDTNRQPDAALTIIDTNAETLESVDASLTNKQIDFIVGPLIKDNIEKLLQLQQSRGQVIPTLALNIPDQIDPAANACYLALSPEQEVAQAAKHLFSQGYRYPLILAPKNSYGERVVEAFNEEWRLYSKNKVAVNLFGDKRQLQTNINSVFGLQDSQQNIAQMESLLGIGMESQPRSRRDIDAVYIVANSAELTLIKPFIEVAINPGTRPPKLFSNSNSNTGGPQYEDLSGVTYSDIPLLVHPMPSIQEQLTQIWPNSSNAERRLQALGMDAYRLMVELPQMKIVEGYTIDGQTGVLSIDEQCVVQREISWAEHSVR